MRTKLSGSQDKLCIKEALNEGRHYLRSTSSSYSLDAEILLSEAIRKPREFLLAHPEERLTTLQASKYRQWLMQRFEGVPIPYSTGVQHFYGRKFIVNRFVLVPRPETEALVEDTINIVKSNKELRSATIADIGTGSGIIAVSLAAELPRVRIIAIDKAGAALRVASRNAKKYRVSKRVSFFASDLMNEIPHELAPSIIVANLPYVTSNELKNAHEHNDTKGLTYEPQGALDGGPDGLAIFRRFFAQFDRFSYLKNALQYLILEHNPKQKRELWEMAYNYLPQFKATKVSDFVTRWSIN